MIGPGGDALIMDFGIARSTGGPEPDPRATPGVPGAFDRAPARYLDATVVGVVIGTVEYMAPEQARGEAVDGRADIYAFGLILYDLLLGRRRAEHAESAVADLQRRLQQPPPPVSTLVPEVSRALDTVVARCVEPDPVKRYQTTDELARDLSRLSLELDPIGPDPLRHTLAHDGPGDRLLGRHGLERRLRGGQELHPHRVVAVGRRRDYASHHSLNAASDSSISVTSIPEKANRTYCSRSPGRAEPK